ncbi:cation:proton antiporter [Staphylococcus pseudintermedius]|uniref:cation:proton antiporter n=1 Tax=Staphylococcus pseudintermedius TaxID=283734 RepID=UPI0018F73EEB|nr:cation:proton antiporter [Staphylococcus pseudintermedius]MBJ8214577.1 cation:proton antiporter [Staphylococcus pseudintermedius]MBJ8222726.1 cation:proton antiporter [Staphylococcus pseudintermedius]MBJ8233763.1 cation:proton antiporter [Staphylococcus pseudintermedius]MBJ8238059.1 cation:proton antiporter [Staphylococcus pseudintermedius]MBJ8238969.1 cation:proton antiporter [Staphylococcus pseudintermedius]
MHLFDLSELLLSGLLIFLLFISAFLANRISAPDIIIFLLIGIVLAFFVSHSEILEFAAETGIVLMFFMLGMEFPIKQLKDLALNIYKAGLLDLLLSFGVTVILVLIMGQPIEIALLLGGVVYATSSSITVKLLEKNNRMTTKDSNFILGLLVFEDIVSPLLVTIIASLFIGEALSATSLSFVFVKIVLLLVGAILLGQVVFKKLDAFVEKYVSEDFFILFMVGLSLTYAGIAIQLGLSEVFGAFLAGIMVAETRKINLLQQSVRNLRDLLMPIFFINFGLSIQLTSGISMVNVLLVLIVWSVISKIIVGYVGGKQFGLNNVPAMRAGLSFTQRGEFSMIIAGFASTQIKTLSGVFILISAIIGVTLFQFAPKIAKRLFKKEKKASLPGSV